MLTECGPGQRSVKLGLAGTTLSQSWALSAKALNKAVQYLGPRRVTTFLAFGLSKIRNVGHMYVVQG